MKTFKNFFFLTALVALVFASFSTATQAQTRASQQPAMVFNADDADLWVVPAIPARVPDGQTVLATHKRDRTQIIALVRGGEIVRVGYKPVGKSFVPLPQNASPCTPSGLCFSFQIQHCYTTPWGACFCVCGAWITLGN